MAKKNDFDTINAGQILGDVSRALKPHTGQSNASAEEQARRAQNGTTRGRKGCKMEKLWCSFTTDNFTFIKAQALEYGNMSAAVNAIITQYREANPGYYEKLKVVLEEGKHLQVPQKDQAPEQE